MPKDTLKRIWTRRSKTDKELEKMERKIRSIYSQANSDLEKKANEYFKKFEKEDNIKRSQLLHGEISNTEYKRWRKRKMMTGEHWKNMVDQTAKSVHNANKIATELINDRLPNIYAINYNGEIKLASSDLGGKFSFEMINQGTVKQLIDAGDKNLLPLKKLDQKKDIPWNARKINSAVTQGIIQGESIPKIAKRIALVTGANEMQSIRAARTIVTQVENKAVHDVARRAAEAGCEVTKSWIATNDNRVRDWHSEADSNYGSESTAIPWDEPFEVMGEFLMEPGDESGSPENIYNCRCSSCNWYKSFKRSLPEGTIRVRWR